MKFDPRTEATGSSRYICFIFAKQLISSVISAGIISSTLMLDNLLYHICMNFSTPSDKKVGIFHFRSQKVIWTISATNGMVLRYKEVCL